MKARWLRITAVLACGIGGCKGATAPETAQLVASLSLAPSPNAMGVTPRDSVVMTFGTSVDTASCRARFALRMVDSTGALIPGHMTFGDGYRRMTFTPDSALHPGSRYFAEMGDSVIVGNGTGGMMGGQMGGMGGSGAVQRMMFPQPPPGAIRMAAGMGWYFTTGS